MIQQTEEQQCLHYKRNCDKKAPCCGIFYPCRLCHDANYKGPKSEGCKVEIMDRFNVTIIRCRKCQKEQPVSNQCIECGIQFAHYYCPICILYDDDITKNIYHCEKCKMCRRGKREENFHCDTCGICLSSSLQNAHKCIQNIVDNDCPVCLENLKISTKFITQLPNCPHYIHLDCFNSLIKSNSRNCPMCSIPIVKMSKEEIQEYDKMAEQISKEMLNQEELKDKTVDIQCLDCRQISKNIPFHFLLKCQQCGSYNTRQ